MKFIQIGPGRCLVNEGGRFITFTWIHKLGLIRLWVSLGVFKTDAQLNYRKE